MACSFARKAWWPPFRKESFTKMFAAKVTEIFGEEVMKPAWKKKKRKIERVGTRKEKRKKKKRTRLG